MDTHMDPKQFELQNSTGLLDHLFCGFRLDDIAEGNGQAMMVRPLVSPTVGKLRVLMVWL
jgi:hypothetical protein